MQPVPSKVLQEKTVTERPVSHVPVEQVQRDNETMKINTRIVVAVYVVLVLLGIGTGYLLSRSTGAMMQPGQTSTVIKTDKVAGSTDTKTFKDSAEGVIQKGGASGEGSHNLVREGGPSQTAYLVSSFVDLDQFVGKKVRVWGQTIGAKKVAWLMDVGRVEILSE